MVNKIADKDSDFTTGLIFFALILYVSFFTNCLISLHFKVSAVSLGMESED